MDPRAQQIVDHLTSLAQRADEALFQEVAAFDHHGDGGGKTYDEVCALHVAGMRHLIHDCGLVVNWKAHFWYPLEAIELRALVPTRGSAESFALATSILLVDDLRGGDRDYMFERLNMNGLEIYQALPNGYAAPVMAGLELYLDLRR